MEFDAHELSVLGECDPAVRPFLRVFGAWMRTIWPSLHSEHIRFLERGPWHLDGRACSISPGPLGSDDLTSRHTLYRKRPFPCHISATTRICASGQLTRPR